MASILRGCCGSLLALGALVVTGCGESFTATTGGEGGGGRGGDATTTTTTGNGGQGGDGGGSTTSTSSSTSVTGCADGDPRECYDGPEGTKNVGKCAAGTQICDGGEWGPCEGQIFPDDVEICDANSVDENCNGSAQEGCACVSGTQEPCYGGPAGTVGKGVCAAGTVTCTEGKWGECKDQTLPSPEVCDAKDNDCNLKKDDVPGVTTDCTTGLPGVCAAGTRLCVAGSSDLVCVGKQESSGEICDGLDNNCNNVLDDIEQEECSMTISGTGETCQGVFKCSGSAGNTAVCSQIGYFFDNFSDGTTWTKGNEWEIGAASNAVVLPGQGNPDPTDDHTPMNNDKKLAGVKIGGTAGQIIHGPYYLTSKPIDTSSAPTLYLSYWRWLNTGHDDETPHFVEVATNGDNWTPIWSNSDGAIYDSAWKLVTHDVSSYASPTFRVRFGFSVAQILQISSISSWNIDDVALSSCPPPDAASP